MTFLATIAGLLVVLLVTHATGWHFARLAPGRLRPQIKLWLAPVVGAAVWLLLFVPLGWFGPGMAHPAVRTALALLALAAVVSLGAPQRWFNSYLRAAVFALVATLPFTVQLLRFGAFDTLNDPWTYMVQSQWLQSHGLADPVPIDNAHGSLTQVYFTKVTGTRAAVQFLLAGIQSLLGLHWAHEAYPIVICLGYAAGSSVVAFAATFFRSRHRSLVPAIAGLMLALTHNGFSLGALRGFLPQTYGLAFTAAGTLMCGWLVGHATALRPRTRVTTGVLAGLLLASAAYAYSEIVPFIGLGCGVLLLQRFRTRQELYTVLQATAAVFFTFGALIAPEVPRILHALAGQARAVVGCAIPWSGWEFATHAMGGLSGYTDGDLFLANSAVVAVIAVALVFALSVAATGLVQRRTPSSSTIPALVILGSFLVLFLYFRFKVPSPFPTGTGQSWSQYKLASWAGIFIFCLSAIGLSRLPGLRLRIVIPIALIGFAVGLHDAWRLSAVRTEGIRREIGRDYEPFHALVEVAREVQSLAPPPVFLDMPAARAKSRQLLAYVLPVGYCLADWADDPFVQWMLPASQRYADRGRALFSIRSTLEPGSERAGVRLANYALGKQASIELPRLETVSRYAMEHHPEGTLNWVDETITYEFLLPETLPSPIVVVESEIISIVQNLQFSVMLSQGASSETRDFAMPEAFGAWSDAPWLRTAFSVAGPERKVTLVIRSAVRPRVISDSDPREVAFLVRNLRLYTSGPLEPAPVQ